MKKVLLLGIILLLVVGCATEIKTVEKPQEPVVEKKPVEEVKEPEPEVIKPILEVPEEPEGCTSDIPPQNLDSIDLTIFTEGLKKTEQGIKFRLLPLDKDGNLIPITGNLRVSMWTTREEKGKLTENLEIYITAFNIKKENVNDDCSSQELLIDFEKLRDSGKYKFVPEGDPGIMKFMFKRTGSYDQFEKTYNAAEYDETIWP